MDLDVPGEWYSENNEEPNKGTVVELDEVHRGSVYLK
jgi:hypothetical protein